MSSKSRKIVLSLILGLFLFLGACCLVLSQPKLLSAFMKYAVNTYSLGVAIEDLDIRQVHWSSWQTLEIKEVKAKLKVNGLKCLFSSSTITLNHLAGLFSKWPVQVMMKGVTLNTQEVQFSGADLDAKIFFNKLVYQQAVAQVFVPDFNYGPYEIRNIKGTILDNQKFVALNNFHARAYDGDVRFSGWLRYQGSLGYEIDIDFDHLNSYLIAAINPAFSQFTAIMDGHMNVKNHQDNALMIKADVHAVSGAQMKASLLMFLAQYIPQKQQIEDLIKKDQAVSLEKARVIITSISPQKVTCQTVLSSAALNLNMNVDFDINMEDGLDQLLKSTH